ncbi:hypothetical protein HDV06_005178 [Boothiomyces sp. JEL0866]|nr:hypothetical protein HDV06_005178 [Boothiomyces sp. JEL0866]
MVRAKFATTATAFVTLGFAFLFCWAELLCYIHAMLIHGTLYWAFQFTSSIADIESPEQNLDFEDSEFVFPESPTYNKTPHLNIAGQDLSPGTNNTQITMGTSAPITIAVQSFRKTSSIENLSVSRTFPLEKINESAHLEHQDTYRFYLKRHAELATAIKLIQSQNSVEATKLLTNHSRHLILPRFALQMIELDLFCPEVLDAPMIIHSTFNKLNACKSIAQNLLNVKDSQAIALVLSDSVTLDLHKLASHNLSPKGSPEDLPDEDPETLFIKYWFLDLECCLADTYLYQGILQLLTNRFLKGAVNFDRAFKMYNKIANRIVVLSHVKVKSALGMLGEAINSIRLDISECHSFSSSFFYLVSSMWPSVLDSYLKTTGLIDDKWLALRTFYQIAIKDSSKSSLSSIFLLYALKVPGPSFFGICHAAEQREILSMLGGIETVYHQSLLQRYLVLKVFRRLGLIDFAQSNCARNLKITNDVFSGHFQFEMAIMHCLKQEYKEAEQIFGAVWKKYLDHEDSAQLLDLDHSSGLLLCAIEGYRGNQKAAISRMEKIHLELSKALTNKYLSLRLNLPSVIKLEKATISWCLELRRVDTLLIYWLLYIRGELSSIAGSRSCIPILINMSIKLNIDYESSESKSSTLNSIYNLVLGTLLKYLVIHKVEVISHFSAIYTYEKLSDLVSNLYIEGITIAKDLPSTHKSLSIYHHLLFENAEFQCTYLRNWNEAQTLLKECLSDISTSSNGHVRSRSNTKSPSIPSFARPHDQRRPSSRSISGPQLSVGSDGPLSTSLSSHNLDWGMDSRISEVGGQDDIDHEFELKCKSALKLLSKYTI